ncbi:TonB-dependent receptor plug domain protein [Bordetella bronchiseptica MBORD707]|nr:TonB-dependent receptor plug domain protein [Bordetella bronchiseptica MBORD707]
MKYVSLAGLAAALLALPAPATAQARPAPYELDSILVEGEAPAQASTFTETADDFARNNVHDARDLLREHTGVSVVEAGRAGGNGFAIRGVEGNRVAITVDGVAQADNILPAVYAGYGYFNGNRNDVELEHMREVTVHKGAHSFEAGSGAIGGAVQYRTKDLDDFVAVGRDVGAFLKSGYASRNREWLAVAGAGVRLGKGGFLLQHTRRRGHETRAYGDGADVTGPGPTPPGAGRRAGWPSCACATTARTAPPWVTKGAISTPTPTSIRTRPYSASSGAHATVRPTGASRPAMPGRPPTIAGCARWAWTTIGRTSICTPSPKTSRCAIPASSTSAMTAACRNAPTATC